MTSIDFYVFQQGTPQGRQRLACRLVDKAFRLGHQIYIHTDSVAQAKDIDELLWTYKQNSFVPHGICGQVEEPIPPVLIGHQSEPPAGNEILVNLSGQVPLFFGQFQRVVEVVDQNEEEKKAARQRYTFYRERGYDIRSHDIAN